MKLKFDTSSQLANIVRGSILFFAMGCIVFNIDLTKLIFKKTLAELEGPQIEKTMSTEQYAEIRKLVTSTEEQKQKAQDQQISAVTKVQQEFENEVVGKANKKSTRLLIENGNRFFVPVTIGYRGKMITVPMLIDTGATGIVITPNFAQRLGINQEETTQGSSTVADGRSVGNYNINVDFVAVGPKTKKPLQVHIMPNVGNNDSGILGMSFLADFPHMIDVKSQAIKWL